MKNAHVNEQFSHEPAVLHLSCERVSLLRLRFLIDSKLLSPRLGNFALPEPRKHFWLELWRPCQFPAPTSASTTLPEQLLLNQQRGDGTREQHCVTNCCTDAEQDAAEELFSGLISCLYQDFGIIKMIYESHWFSWAIIITGLLFLCVWVCVVLGALRSIRAKRTPCKFFFSKMIKW